MVDEKKIASAKTVYTTLCEVLDHKQWKYEKDEKDLLTVHFLVRGDDIPMEFILIVDAENQLISLVSPLPFKMSESKRIDGAVATCVASYGLGDGSFDYDISDGKIMFRMTASFRESLIGEELFHYMISCSCATVDEYNDKFLAIDKGLLSITDFIEND